MGIFDSLRFWKKDAEPSAPPMPMRGMDFSPPPGAEPPGAEFAGLSGGGPRFGAAPFPEAPMPSLAQAAGSERDFQVLSAKLDTIHAQLDLVLQRLEALQRPAQPEERAAPGRAEPWRWR